MADGGPLQLSLFDEQDLAEITSPQFPGERLIACRNPVLAAERARKREDLLAATEDELGKIAARVTAGRLKDPDKIGVAAGKIINKRKVAKHFDLDIAEGRLSWRRDQATIDAEAATDGIYVIRTPVPADTLDAAGAVTAYKALSRLERDFRSIKADDLDLRPIFHRLEDRVRAHVLICMLACYLTWHLRQAWAPLTYTDEHPPQRANPVAPARRSPSADAKAARKTGPGSSPSAASATSWTTWPPSPATTCATARSPSPPSPNPPPTSGAPSTSSAHPSHSPSAPVEILVVNSRHAACMLDLGRLGGHDLARGRSSPSSRPRNRVCHVHAACRLAGAGSADRRGDRRQVLREAAAAAGGAGP